MARGTTLVRLVDDLRAECRLSLNPAHNAQSRDTQIKALQRKQEFFWNDFAWPHLRVERFIDVEAGQRFYDLAGARDAQGDIRGDLDITRISKIEVRQDSTYQRLRWGIGASQYAAYDSELGVRGWPIQNVQITEDEQLEVWPVPDTNFCRKTLEGRIKVTGIRKLRLLAGDNDRCDIDGHLLVMHCAAEYLAAAGAQDAQIKLDQANALYLKLRSQLMPRRVFSMFVNREKERAPRYPIAVYRSTGGR